MSNYITLDIELGAIKGFLCKTLEGVDTEKATIFAKEEAGEFSGLDDLSNTLFNPMEREAIAIRAVLYEINALIEWEIGNIAIEAYSSSTKYKKTAIFLRDVSSVEGASHIKFVWGLPFGEICRLIEEHYKISLPDLPAFEQVQSIRQSVNAFKHRKGYKDFRRNLELKIGDKFEPTRENAYQAIEGSRTFLRALWKKIKKNKA
jgi:hypothetical protein